MNTRISSKTLISGENACWMMFAEMGMRLVTWLSGWCACGGATYDSKLGWQLAA